MLENRGDYFKERIKELEKEAEHLQMQKQEIKEIKQDIQDIKELKQSQLETQQHIVNFANQS